MITKRYRYHVACASLLALTSACSDDASNGEPKPTTDAGGNDAATPRHDSSSAASDTTAPAPTHTASSADAGSSAGEASQPESPDGGAPTLDLPDASSSGVDSTTGDLLATHSGGVDSQNVDSGAPSAEMRDSGTTSDTSASDTGPSNAGSSDSAPSDAGVVDVAAATAFFWEAFTQQRVDDGARVSAQLEAALAVNPGDANLALLVAHSYLWRLSEFGRTTAPDPTQVPALAGATEAGFARAFAQAPADARILGWLGSVMMGNGSAMGDDEKVGAGHALIERGVTAYPEFNGFVLSLVNASAPVGTPEFDLALEAMWDNLDVCAGFTANREVPDVRAAVAAVLEGEADPACANTLRAAHNLEGFFLYFGDLLLKANQETAARAMYDATRASPTFELWPYRETLNQREQSIAARLAAYTNEDPSDDPALIAQEPFNCAYCHAASPEEPLPFSFEAAP